MGRTLGILLCAACLFPASSRAQTSAQSCVVILEQAPGKTPWRSDEKACATRLAPASTFKIPHALVGLETGVITPSTVYEWDGTRHPDQPEWNHSHTVLTALRPSVLWFFQRMAPQIGAARMHGWLERLHYGNADTSGDVKLYGSTADCACHPTNRSRFSTSSFGARCRFERSRSG